MSTAPKLCAIVIEDQTGKLGRTLRPIKLRTGQPLIPAAITSDAKTIYDATNDKIIKYTGSDDMKRMRDAIVHRLAFNTIPYLEAIYHPSSIPQSDYRTISGYFDRESGFRCGSKIEGGSK